MENTYILEMEHISKAFYGVTVLDDVSFRLCKGETRALLGENGAGKSTLMKILCGIYKSNSGSILLNGSPVKIQNAKDARALGIGIVHQEISLVGEMTIAENIFLGSEPVKAGFLLNMKEIGEKVQIILDELELDLDANWKIKTLSVAQQQMIEIAKAIYFNAKVLVLDEPTAALSNAETEALFKQMQKLKAKGVSIIYISHRLDEIYQVCDNISILRDGHCVAEGSITEIDQETLVRHMVGRDLSDIFNFNRVKGGDTILEVKNFKNKYLKDVSLKLNKGEILGIYGLVGARRTELSRAIFGTDNLESGALYMDGSKIRIKSPRDAIRNGIGLIPEDRKRQGLVLMHSVEQNISMLVIEQYKHGLRLDKKGILKLVEDFREKLSIKMSGPRMACQFMSGGNQQKVVIAKWMAAKPKIIIFDEPTRGVDIAAKSDIYKLIIRLAEEGASIIVISSEMPEIMNLSSRILVMHEGEISGTIEDVDMDPSEMQELIMKYAIGGYIE